MATETQGLVTVTNSSFFDGLEIYAETKPDEYTESGEWIGSQIVVKVNDLYWWEDTYGRMVDPLEQRFPLRNFRRPYVSVGWSLVTAEVVKTTNALAVPFDRNQLNGMVSAQLLQLTVDRANEALQAQRKFERDTKDKLVLSPEEQDEALRLITQVHETQGDFMYASRNRSFQQHGIWPGMKKSKHIAHVHVGAPLQIDQYYQYGPPKKNR